MNFNLSSRGFRSVCMAAVLAVLPAVLIAGPVKQLHKKYTVTPIEGELKTSLTYCEQVVIDGILGLKLNAPIYINEHVPASEQGYYVARFGCLSDTVPEVSLTIKWRCTGGTDKPKIRVAGSDLHIPDQAQVVGEPSELSIPIGHLLKPGANSVGIEATFPTDQKTFQILSLSFASEEPVLFSGWLPSLDDFGPETRNLYVLSHLKQFKNEALHAKEVWEATAHQFIVGTWQKKIARKCFQTLLDYSNEVVNNTKSGWIKGSAKEYADFARFELLEMSNK